MIAVWLSRRPARASRSSWQASRIASTGALLAERRLRRPCCDALGAVRTLGGQGGAIVLTRDGRFAVAFDTPAMARGWRDASGSTVRPLSGGDEPGPAFG